jgi:hypothetical protein
MSAKRPEPNGEGAAPGLALVVPSRLLFERKRGKTFQAIAVGLMADIQCQAGNPGLGSSPPCKMLAATCTQCMILVPGNREQVVSGHTDDT